MPLTKVTVGLSYEGPLDKPIIHLISRIGLENSVSTEIIHTIRAGSGLLGYVAPHLRQHLSYTPDVIIFLTDQDQTKDDLERRVLEKVKNNAPHYSARTVVGVPSPHFEAWLTRDDNLLKSYFALDGSRPIPGNELEPKSMLTSLHRGLTPARSIFEVYEELAQNIDMNVTAKKSPDFKRFQSALKMAFTASSL